MSEKSKTYEENIQRLEELVGLLEKGEVTLEEGLAAFEEGVGLIKVCQQQLERVASKIQVVTKDGELSVLPEQEEA
ncbi:MAG: exodeoxyribonuclease VII small subunit [Peptococcia bacterium]